jgi:hypothetical protein
MLAAFALTWSERSCTFGILQEGALRGLADIRSAEGARTMAKSKALRIRLRAFIVGSLEYIEQQNDFAIKYAFDLTLRR